MKVSSTLVFKAIVIVSFFYVFMEAKSIYLPILASVGLSFILYPIVNRLTNIKVYKLKIGKIPAIFIAFLFAVTIAIGLLSILVIPLVEEIEKLYRNVPQMLVTIDQLLDLIKDNVIIPIVNSGIYREQSEQIFIMLQQAISKSAVFSFNLLKNIASLSFSFLSRSVELIVIPVLTFYLLKDWNVIVDWVISLFSLRSQSQAKKIIYEMGTVISDFLTGQFLLCIIIGTISFIGFYQMNIGYPFVLATLAAMAEAIPIIGPILSAVPAIILGLAVSTKLGLKVAIFCFFLQQLENHVILPRVMGKSVNLHPVIIIISLLIGGQFLGVLGMLLALPVTALLNIFMQHFWIEEEKS